MKLSSLALLFFLSLLSVSSALPSSLPWPEGVPSPVVVLSGSDGRGTGCVSGGRLWTAAHVVDVAEGGALQWSASPLQGGAVDSSLFFRDKKADLAWMIGPPSEMPHSIPLAPGLPESGERLWLLVRTSDGERHRLVHFAMWIDSDDELITDGLGWPGMSGGCLVNERNELVGIHLGTVSTLANRENPGGYRAASRYAVVAGRK